MDLDLQLAMHTARNAAEAGGSAALKHYRTGVRVDTKADNSPVTVADKQAEAAIIDVIRKRFPDHGILGEETGEKPSLSSEFRWIIDPLDGTRGFTRGTSFWGPLVALERGGDVIAGAMSLPVLETTYWAARGQGAYRNGQEIQVSSESRWEHCILSLGELGGLLSRPNADAIKTLIQTSFSARCYGDVAGCAMVLDGVADAWLESGVQIWDIAPFPILLSEAGGRFTDFDGEENEITSGNAIGSNGVVHNELLAALG